MTKKVNLVKTRMDIAALKTRILSRGALLSLAAAGFIATEASTAETASFNATILPEKIASLKVPLQLGYQLGIPARDNSAFYAECFSTDALRQAITQLNERIEIGLLISHSVNPDNGEISVVLRNESEELKGITLRTGYLLRGKSYTARVYAEKVYGQRGVTLRACHEHNHAARSERKKKVSRWSGGSALKWSVTPRLSGFYHCSFLIEPDSSLELRGFSLLPDESVSIWRRESIDVLRNAGAGALRWPVVEGMDFYNWYDGVGPRSTRVPVQPEKTGLTHHDFGTAEYVDFCRVVGVEPLICVPLYTPACGDARVKELNDATRLAADWVAYCNADDDHPLAALREKNGLRKPPRVKYWELVAPAVGPLLTADMIASASLHTINAMKAEDSGIIVGVTLRECSLRALEVLLELAGTRIDFISCDTPGAYKVIERFNRLKDGEVLLAATTLQSDYGAYAATQLASLESAPGEAREYYINWYRSLGLANAAVSRLREGRDAPVCLPYHAEQVLGLNHGGTRLSTDIGLLGAMIGRFPAVCPLKHEMNKSHPGAPVLYPAQTQDKEVLVVFVYNPSVVAQSVKLDLSRLKKRFNFWIMDQLSADMNAAPRGENVAVIRNQRAGAIREKTIECPLGAVSFTRILIKK